MNSKLPTTESSFTSIDPHLYLSYRHFDDAENFHYNLNFFKVDVWQLSNGKFAGNLIEVAGDNVQIDRHHHNRLLKLQGTPISAWAFGVPVHPLCLLFEQKYQLEDDYILISPPQSSFRMLQKSAYGLYVIHLNEEFLTNLCLNYHLPEPSKLLGQGYFHPWALSCSSMQLATLRQSINRLHQQILRNFNQPQLLASSIRNYWIQQLDWEIPKQLMLILAQAQNIQPKKVFLRRISTLNQAEEFMNTYAKADITTEDICQAVGVSKRTLEYIFKDYYGISPKAYLKQLRLNQFRQALKIQVAQGTKINEMAKEWGFWHSGQLAADYYRLFGELPKETISL